MMKKAIAGIALVFGLTTAAVADQGGYVGGGFGTSHFDNSFAIVGFSQDDSDTASMLFAGYKFSKYFSFEGRYSDYGSFLISGDGTDVSAVSVHAVGTVPFGSSGWELYGQLGYGLVTFDFFSFAEEDEAAFGGGIGLRYRPSRNFAIGLQADAFAWDDNLLGPAYDSGVASTTLTASIYF